MATWRMTAVSRNEIWIRGRQGLCGELCSHMPYQNLLHRIFSRIKLLNTCCRNVPKSVSSFGQAIIWLMAYACFASEISKHFVLSDANSSMQINMSKYTKTYFILKAWTILHSHGFEKEILAIYASFKIKAFFNFFRA